jgi:FtsZ-interacting cell division protein ZipA
MNTTLVIVIVIVVVIVLAAGASALFIARNKRTQRLREQFGPEYDRSIEQGGTRRDAESELRAREKRHQELELRELPAEQRDEFQRRWTLVQGEFVDDPTRAVGDADRLVTEVMSARGYPVEEFDQRADDLSVRYPRVTQHYRQARRIAQANERGEAGTEDLRHAVTSYRSLVTALLSDQDARQHNGGDGDTRTQDTHEETRT